MVGQGISRTRKVFLWRQNCQTSFAFFFLSSSFASNNPKNQTLHLEMKTRKTRYILTQNGPVWANIWKYSLLECSEKDQNCKLQFPQPDYWPRHSPDFRTVFGIMIGPFSFCEIGKTWGTNKQINNKQTKIEIFNFHNQITKHVTVLISEHFLESWLDHFPLAKLAKRGVHKMRKSPI